MRTNEKICIGVIANAHGIRGGICIKTFTDAPEAFGDFQSLQNEAGDCKFKILKSRPQKANVIIAHVEGVIDRNAAEALKGTKLCIDRGELSELEAGEYYHTDLVGLRVLTNPETEVGKVGAVYNFGAGDLLDIQLPNSKRAVTLAFNQDMVPEVNINKGYVVVDKDYFSQLSKIK